MSKKLTIVAVAVLGIVLAIGSVLAVNSYKKRGAQSDTTGVQNISGNKEASTSRKTWSDTSGFSFTYDGSLVLTDKTPDNGNYYSLLELKGRDGIATISLYDTTYKDISSYVAKNDDLKTAKLSGGTNLAGVTGSTYETSNKIYTLAVNQGVLYEIIADKNDYFDKEISSIVDSFELTDGQKTSPVAPGTSSNTVYEQEEVVE